MTETLKKCMALLSAAVVAIGVSGCSLFGKDSDDSSDNEITSSKKGRYITTTQTARYAVDGNNDDEDLSGYKTTRDTETGSLANPIPDEPDPDILATTTTTLYTIPKSTAAKDTKKSNKTTKKSVTALAADKLHYPDDKEKFNAKKKYKVTSDTTYLNLRFGPGKNYKVQVKIPDGESIFGTAKTKGNDGSYWIYVSYKGTDGWVMEELLKVI